jgi:hypothetical protein
MTWFGIQSLHTQHDTYRGREGNVTRLSVWIVLLASHSFLAGLIWASKGPGHVVILHVNLQGLPAHPMTRCGIQDLRQTTANDEC